MHKTLQETLKTGWIVIGVLAVMTIAEFIVAVAVDDKTMLFALLLIVALLKAWLIIQYFMHFGQLWAHVAEVWDGILSNDPEADREED
ncbi:MAG: cytochrome C oxidase subunit IV family protein [Chloroflexi bacterium]|jgi:cytochrome c oxidase subunit IV|nr:cytochrome C oxidase subunit IV family protein [Chloroflexota bacterium]